MRKVGLISVVFLIFGLILTSSCSLINNSSPNQETQIALVIVATENSIKLQTQSAALTKQASDALAVPPTSIPVPTDPPSATDTPFPTRTTAPTRTLLPTKAAVPTDPPPPTPDLDAEFQAWLPSAQILLFEDIAPYIGYFGVKRIVKEALDGMDLNYKDTKELVGRYKTELLAESWDLIIQSGESRSGATGEFFDYLDDQLDSGASVIVEMWQLDSLHNGRVSQLLSRCGLVYQSNWISALTDDRTLHWVTEHPILHEPNDSISLTRYKNFWYGDVGDFMELDSGNGDSFILAGRDRNNDSGDGTLAVCNNGQFILQTYSSHDYIEAEAIKVWQNLIYAALKQRFLSK
jgi:hypothetical protein